jgi:ornithine carbamoyltransferase
MHDFLSLDELAAHDLRALISCAAVLEEDWRARQMPQKLRGKRVALIVDDRGWRNTTAFDLGVQAMGGLCAHAPVTFDDREAIADVAHFLDNWFDIIVVRTPSLTTLRQLADAAYAPVVNARTQINHPCEVLGDLCFVNMRLGRIDEIKVVVIAPDGNILRSWIEAAAVLPIEVIQVYAEPWLVVDTLPSRGSFRARADLRETATADVVITDCWPKAAAPDQLLPFQVTGQLLKNLKAETLFIPCPPVTRGQEVSVDAMNAPCCNAVDAKACLLHAQNALLEWVLT